MEEPELAAISVAAGDRSVFEGVSPASKPVFSAISALWNALAQADADHSKLPG